MPEVSKKRRGFTGRLIQVLAIIAGLWGGWIAAGILNDHRSDVPRPVPPTTMPGSLSGHS
jgi:hypothetical protein